MCVFGEKLQPVLKILLTVTRHLYPVTLATCSTTHNQKHLHFTSNNTKQPTLAAVLWILSLMQCL